MYMYTVEQLYVGVYTPKGKWGGGNQQDLCRVAGKNRGPYQNERLV